MIIQPKAIVGSKETVNRISFSHPLTPIEPIIIDQDSDFSLKYGFLGTGSENTPFIIENYNITKKEGLFTGIYIWNTTAHFIIRNCYIEVLDYGIYINEIQDGTATVENNIIFGSIMGGIRSISGSVDVAGNTVLNCTLRGIRIEDGGTISNNTVENSYNGIEGRDAIIEENTVENCYTGIYLYDNCQVSKNNILNNDKGIEYYSATGLSIDSNFFDSNINPIYSQGQLFETNNNITNNIFENSKEGCFFFILYSTRFYRNSFDKVDMHFFYTVNLKIMENQFYNSSIFTENNENLTLIGNQFLGGGIEIYELKSEDYFTHLIEDNLVNGKEIGFFVEQSSLNIDGGNYGQLILINCSDSAIQNLDISRTLNGLYLKDCTNLYIQNNVFHDNNMGILSTGSDYLIIEDNIFDDCIYGISFNYVYSFSGFVYRNYKVDSVLIKNNDFIKCGFKCNPYHSYTVGTFGMPDFQYVYDIVNITLSNNKVNEKALGYFVNLNNHLIMRERFGQIILINSRSITIKNQDLSFTSIGIEVVNSTLVNIENCVLNSNKKHGIFLRSDSDNATILKNTCDNNAEIGICIEASDSILVTKNQCIENSQGIGFFFRSKYSIISYNLVEDNSGYGINLGGDDISAFGQVDNTLVHHNTIVNNSGPLDPIYHSLVTGYQAYNKGINNTWYDNSTKEGNFWSDYNGTGEYLIIPRDGAVDLYPLSKPTWPLSSPELYALFALLLLIPIGIIIYRLYKKKKEDEQKFSSQLNS